MLDARVVTMFRNELDDTMEWPPPALLFRGANDIMTDIEGDECGRKCEGYVTDLAAAVLRLLESRGLPLTDTNVMQVADELLGAIATKRIASTH